MFLNIFGLYFRWFTRSKPTSPTVTFSGKFSASLASMRTLPCFPKSKTHFLITFSNLFNFSYSGQIKNLKWTTFTWLKMPFDIWKCDSTENWRTTSCKKNVVQLCDFSTNLNLRFKKEMDPLPMLWKPRQWLDLNKALLIKSSSKPSRRLSI